MKEAPEKQAEWQRAVNAIIAALGDGWKQVPPAETMRSEQFAAAAKVIPEGTLRLNFTSDGYHYDKAIVGGEFPFYRNSSATSYLPNYSRQTITISVGRLPVVAAGDINRRFIIDYAKTFCDSVEAVKQEERESQEFDDRVKKLAGVANLEYQITDHHDGAHINIPCNDGPFYGGVNASRGSVQIELRSVTFDAAEAILKVLDPMILHKKN